MRTGLVHSMANITLLDKGLNMLWQVKIRYLHNDKVKTIIETYATSRAMARRNALAIHEKNYGISFQVAACEASRVKGVVCD